MLLRCSEKCMITVLQAKRNVQGYRRLPLPKSPSIFPKNSGSFAEYSEVKLSKEYNKPARPPHTDNIDGA